MSQLQVKEALKRAVVEAGRAILHEGLTVGTWGNISVRDPDTGLIYITPSGVDYNDIREEHIVVINSALEVVDGHLKPSSERQMHVAVYEVRADVHAIIHDHPIYSSVLGVNRMELPGIGEDMVEIIGDKVICAEYALPGTSELAGYVAKALGDRNAVLLPNHGALCVGENLKQALQVCRVLEKTAQIYILARLTGTPHVLSDDQIRAMQHFARYVYGQR